MEKDKLICLYCGFEFDETDQSDEYCDHCFEKLFGWDEK